MAKPSDIEELRQRLALVEARLEQLFEHLELAPPAAAKSDELDPNEDPEIQDLLAKGNEAQAVKRYRELTGAGIAEAQSAIRDAQGAG
jgi:ribosomal protein L7/L12